MANRSDLERAMRDISLSAEERRDASLELLQMSKARSVVDDALRTLNSGALLPTLDDAHRVILREKYHYYHTQPPEKDKAGMLRESITRLLVHIGHRDDADIYLWGVNTYHHQPIDDVAQNLRAVALAGLGDAQPELACAYATKLIGEDDASVFNCEPSVTAIHVLAKNGHDLPIYQFILHRGRDFCAQAKAEAVGRALAGLSEEFPQALYEALIREYQLLDVPPASVGIIERVTQGRYHDLYAHLFALIEHTRDDDLFHYGVMACAAARDDILAQHLIEIAKTIHRQRIDILISAIELIAHPQRDTTLATLRKRLKGA
jgi:hypothetical protein